MKQQHKSPRPAPTHPTHTPHTRQRLGSVQASYLPLHAVRDTVLCLEDRTQQPPALQYRAIVEVTGLNFALLSATEQQMMFEGYQQLMASLSFPTQILVRIQPLDLEAYLAYIRLPVQTDGAISAAKDPTAQQADRALVQSHEQFLAHLTANTLLERRFYIIIAANDGKRERHFFWQQKRPYRERQALNVAQAEQQLKLRCDVVTSALENLNLHTRVLAGSEIIQLYDDILGGASRTRKYPLTPEILTTAIAPSPHHAIELSLADVTAPESIRVEPNYLCIDEREYVCTLAVHALPHKVQPGWLQPLVSMDMPMDITMYQTPRNQVDAIRFLRRKEAQLEGADLYMRESGRNINPEMRLAAQNITPLLEKVTASEERLHDVGFHIMVRATSPHELEERVGRVSETVYAVAHHRPQRMLYEQERGLKLALPGNMMAADLLPLESTTLATMLPFINNLMYQPSETAFLEGITPQQEPVLVDPWTLENYNRFLIAPSGSGKSYKTKLDIMRLYMMYTAKAYRERKKPHDVFQVIVIDPEREYAKLANAFGGQWIRLSAGSGHHINPFDLPRLRLQRDEAAGYEKEDVLKNQINRLHQLLDRMLAYHSPDNPNASLTDEEKSLLDIALYEVYRKAGIMSDISTHHRQPPLLRDLYHTLGSGECGEDKSGLAPRLRRYVYGSLSGLFSGQTNVELTNPLVIFDTKELESELHTVGMMMVSSLVWNLSFASMIPRHLIIDELATLYQYRSGARFAEDLFRRARKQYLGVTGITQQPNLFQESGIMSNCATHLLMKQNSTSIDQVTRLFKLTPKEAQLVRSFKRGEGLMFVDGKRIHLQFLSSEVEHQLATSKADELARWEQERIEQERVRETQMQDQGQDQPEIQTTLSTAAER